jgi:UDP-N-acetylenolpyruvoylglucosamine reductase
MIFNIPAYIVDIDWKCRSVLYFRNCGAISSIQYSETSGKLKYRGSIVSKKILICLNKCMECGLLRNILNDKTLIHKNFTTNT